MKIGFISEWNVFDPKLRSGVPFNIAKALVNNGCELTQINISDNRRPLYAKMATRAKSILINRILSNKKGLYNAQYDVSVARYLSKSAEKQIDESFDLILSISTRSVSDIGSKVKTPIVLWLDNTFNTYFETYEMPLISKLTKTHAFEIESKAFHRADLILCASEWLKNEIHQKFSIPLNKIKILNRGANLVGFSNVLEVELNLESKSDLAPFRILFSNTHWTRKGGDIVWETCEKLNENGFNFHLDIVGTTPPVYVMESNYDWYTYHGRFRQDVEGEAERYRRLFRESHLLFVPTKAEGFGIIYAEAASFGLPSLATDIMGVTASVIDQITGFRFPIEATANQYAEKIVALQSDKKGYIELCISSFRYYQSNFRWDENVKKMLKMF